MNGPVNHPYDYEQAVTGWNKPPSNWWIFFLILSVICILLFIIDNL